MSGIAFELIVIVVLIMINGAFSMSEIAIVTAKRVRLEHQADGGSAGARAALNLATDPSHFLSTVQVGITLVGVIASVYGGATLSEVLAARLTPVAWIGDHANAVALAIVVATITYLSVIVGELVPKRIALGNPERIAALVARPMIIISRIGRPIVVLLTASTQLILRLFGIRGVAQPGLTEDEIHAVIEQGAETGVVPRLEHEVVESVFRLGDRHVGSIMTPRTEVEWLDVNSTAAALRSALTAQHRAWQLVCDGEIDQVLGIVQTADLLSSCLAGERLDLRAALREPLYVPVMTPAFRLLEAFRSSRQHVAVIMDEYGGIEGTVALEDIVEELIGAMPSIASPDAPVLVRGDAGGWIVSGAAAIQDVQEAIDLPAINDEARQGYRTLGGFIFSRLGRIPKAGDVVGWGDFSLGVESMDGRRIDRVRIVRFPPSPSPRG